MFSSVTHLRRAPEGARIDLRPRLFIAGLGGLALSILISGSLLAGSAMGATATVGLGTAES